MKNKRKNINKKYKIVFTDYYFEDINKEIEILNRLGNVEIIDCNDFTKAKNKENKRLVLLVINCL